MSYPRRRVFWAFFFCPLAAGGGIGIVKFLYFLAHLVSTPKLIGEVRVEEFFIMPIVLPLVAQLGFFLPFSAFAMVVSLMEVYKRPRTCTLVGLVGGSLATVWSLLFVVVVALGLKNAHLASYVVEMLVIFLGSTVTCWLAAIFFLPEYS